MLEKFPARAVSAKYFRWQASRRMVSCWLNSVLMLKEPPNFGNLAHPPRSFTLSIIRPYLGLTV